MPANSWTERRVFDQLRHVWPDGAGAYVRLPQVRNGTGFTRKQTRTADALIASCWPSRGLWLAGVEIKVTLSDWKKELASPEKADEIGQYCHYWYVAAPAGVIPHEQVPETWGLIEVTGNTAKIVQGATKRDAKPIDTLMLCAILRSTHKEMVPRHQARAEQADAIEKVLADQEQYKNNSYELKELRRRVEDFEEASGVKIAERWDLGNVAKAVKVIQDAGDPSRAMTRLRDHCQNAVNLAIRINEVIAELDGMPEVHDA